MVYTQQPHMVHLPQVVKRVEENEQRKRGEEKDQRKRKEDAVENQENN